MQAAELAELRLRPCARAELRPEMASEQRSDRRDLRGIDQAAEALLSVRPAESRYSLPEQTLLCQTEQRLRRNAGPATLELAEPERAGEHTVLAEGHRAERGLERQR